MNVELFFGQNCRFKWFFWLGVFFFGWFVLLNIMVEIDFVVL